MRTGLFETSSLLRFFDSYLSLDFVDLAPGSCSCPSDICFFVIHVFSRVVPTTKQAELDRRLMGSCRGRSQRRSTRRKRSSFKRKSAGTKQQLRPSSFCKTWYLSHHSNKIWSKHVGSYTVWVCLYSISLNKESQICISTFHHAIVIVSPELCHIVIKMWLELPTL